VDIKDYYTILELPPSASFDEIKKSYRRLAHIYHPDKKIDDPYAAARFTEIKEAYEVLTNPHKKDLYLQQRWYAQSIGRKRTELIVTPETLLKRMLELDRYIYTLDTHRMDKEGLYHYVLHILSIENIEKLNSFNEPDINREIIRCALKCAYLIPFTDLDNYLERIKKIDAGNESFTQQVTQLYRQRRQSHYWEKHKGWIVLLIVLIFCISVFMLIKK
jgi:curved DNA-binding protein CbpA